MERQPANVTGSYHLGRKRINIEMRDPFYPPDDKVELPTPEPAPPAPAPVSKLMIIIPPLVMILGAVVTGVVSQGSSNGFLMMLPMVMMGLGMPIANFVNHGNQMKNHKRLAAERQARYQKVLAEKKRELDAKVDQARALLENEYPRLNPVCQIGLSRGKDRRLWWRRTEDEDFLALRLGTGSLKPSITVTSQKQYDQTDPLPRLAAELAARYAQAPEMPMLVDLKRAGSLMLVSKQPAAAYGYTRRLVLDILVHHSPEDVHLALLADGVGAAERWKWLKWAPHTQALYPGQHARHLAFTSNDIKQFLIYLSKEVRVRKEKLKEFSGQNRIFLPALVVILDDTGPTRQSLEIAALAAEGHLLGIYLLFVGAQNTPNTCRAKVDMVEGSAFKYQETRSVDTNPVTLAGALELASEDDCELVSRSLAGLEVSGGQLSYKLPEVVRISDILGPDPLHLETIRQNWTAPLADEDQALFPVGEFVTRDGPEVFSLDFRPETRQGLGQYNAFLIGTTGSGKSIFLQALVAAAAHRYSPKVLNFLLLDFKAGAAELAKIKLLPHVVGCVNDLQAKAGGLAERALQALENELDRRKRIFDAAGKVSDIWDFNTRYPQKSIPHLLTVVDEFEAGIELLPDLIERLTELGRQGRAFGMYFLLANQRICPAIERLKANVGWNIVLKVQTPEEMALVDRTLPIPPGRGRGYTRVGKEITQFQGAWAGAKVVHGSIVDDEKFSIEQIAPDGQVKTLYTHVPTSAIVESGTDASQTELDLLVAMMQQTAQDLNIPPAQPIYLEPVPVDETLSDILDRVTAHRRFESGGWSQALPARRLVAPLGMLDIPQDCLQIPLEIDFKQKDGNLWIIGAPGSGVEQTLETTILSLVATHQPDEAQFYILDYGAGTLRQFEALPHCGGVLRMNDLERLERLIRFIDAEIQKRTENECGADLPPDLFIVVNNFAELRATYSDQSDAFIRWARTGKAAGIHLILATNRGSELPRNISSNIGMRIVLNLATRDEYPDVLGTHAAPVSLRAERRGYWVFDGVAECQVAAPKLSGVTPTEIHKAWSGCEPRKILTLSESYTFRHLEQLCAQEPAAGVAWAPVGIAFDTLELVQSNLDLEIPNWLVLGPHTSGRSNFLMAFAQGIELRNPDQFETVAFSLRRGPLVAWRANNARVCGTPAEIIQECQKLIERPASGNARRCLVMVDDLGAAFEPGKEELAKYLNNLANALPSLTDVVFIAAAMREELQSQIASPVVKLLRQSRTGVIFSREPMDADWLGISLTLAMRRSALPVGRGFFASKGVATLVQTFKAG